MGWAALRELLWEVASHQLESVHASIGLAPRRAPDGGSADPDGGAGGASSSHPGSPSADRFVSPTAHRSGSPTAHRSSLGDSRHATPKGQRSGAWKGTVIRSATAAAGARSGATVFVDGRAVPPPGAAAAALGRQISAARKVRQKRDLELSSLGARLQLCEALRTTLAERTEAIAAPNSAPNSAPISAPHDEIFRELRDLRAEIEAKMLSHEVRSPGLSAATSALSTSMLFASKLDAAHAAAHTLIAHAAELRGIAECASTLAARFPAVEALWGIIPALRARLRAVEAEAVARLADAAALSTAEESNQVWSGARAHHGAASCLDAPALHARAHHGAPPLPHRWSAHATSSSPSCSNSMCPERRAARRSARRWTSARPRRARAWPSCRRTAPSRAPTRRTARPTALSTTPSSAPASRSARCGCSLSSGGEISISSSRDCACNGRRPSGRRSCAVSSLDCV